MCVKREVGTRPIQSRIHPRMTVFGPVLASKTRLFRLTYQRFLPKKRLLAGRFRPALRFATRGPPHQAYEADLSAPGASRRTGGRVSSNLAITTPSQSRWLWQKRTR